MRTPVQWFTKVSGGFGRGAIVLLCLASLGMETPGRGEAAPEIAAAKSAEAENLRLFLLDREPAATPADPENGEPDLWIEYAQAALIKEPEEREAHLQGILKRPISDALREVILRDIASDLEFQSRRAQFIRSHGFYSNWFNRISYAISRTLQGNIQAGGQLVVDGIFDVFGRSETTPAERRLYRLLRELDAERGASAQDRERIEKLERKVNLALAEVDLERANWALTQGDPELAEFYARGAAGLSPELKKAEALQRKAASAAAARRRAAVASLQVGYPDRKPPVELSSASLVRAVLSGQRGELQRIIQQRAGAAGAPSSALPSPQGDSADLTLSDSDAFLATVMTTLSDQDDGGIMAMRQWVEAMNDMDSEKLRKTAWLQGLLHDPRFNADLRLARSQSTRRGSLTKFIFVGPDTSRERAYELTSRTAQAWNALSNVGLFYVFEVMYRAGIVAFRPPPPADEMLDSAANFLRVAPLHPDSRQVAAWLAGQYRTAGRYDQAREVLARFGQLDVATNQKLQQAEARKILSAAEALPPGNPKRQEMLQKVMTLAPASRLATRAEKKSDETPRPGEKITIEIEWDALASWLAKPLPAGLPGDVAWFDGDLGNGEIDGDTVSIEAEGEQAARVQIDYAILRGETREIVDETLDLKAAPETLRGWIRMELAEAARRQQEIKRLGRPPIPYEFTGGAGLSGVDFYPRMLPIEQNPSEMRLYQD